MGEQLLRRHINTEGKCKRCGNPESINHLFFECDFARRVWDAAPVSPSIEFRGLIDLEVIWTNLCARTCLPPIGISTGCLAPWILWQLWISRNILCFENREISAIDTGTRAIGAAKEWEACQRKTKALPKFSKPSPKLPMNCAIIQSDAAWKEDMKTAGLGWTISHLNRTISSSATESSVRSPLSAEGLALREAILQCKRMEISNICCESDSLQLVQAVNSVSPISELYSIVADIHSCLASFDFIFFRWIPRLRNVAADNLAKSALSDAVVVMALT